MPKYNGYITWKRPTDSGHVAAVVWVTGEVSMLHRVANGASPSETGRQAMCGLLLEAVKHYGVKTVLQDDDARQRAQMLCPDCYTILDRQRENRRREDRKW